MPSKSSRELAHRIYLAKGEYESFQIALRTTRDDELAAVEVEAVNTEMGPPQLRWVGYVQSVESPSPASVGGRTLRPDPLHPFDTLGVPANVTRSIWVTYHAPRTMKAGIYTNEIALRFGKRTIKTLTVTIEVFDFALPEVPRLRSLFSLDRLALQRFYGLSDTNFDDWQPVYDALAPYRFSWSMWDGGPLVAARGGRFDAGPLKEHLEYAVAQARMNTIDISSPRLFSIFPPPDGTARQDPLQIYLHEMNNWLHDQGWLNRGVVNLGPVGPRAGWEDIRARSVRVHRLDNRAQRLLEGPLHPYLESAADQWALRTENVEPTGITRLRTGRSLGLQTLQPATEAYASSASPDTRPGDAADGSFFSAWKPADGTGGNWLEIHLPDVVKADTLYVHARERTEIRAYTAMDRGGFRPATVRWRWTDAGNGVAGEVGTGRLKVAKTFSRLRLAFNEPVAIQEVCLSDPSMGIELPSQATPTFWLAASLAGFPALGIHAESSLEHRLFGWVCANYGLEGVTGISLNDWPVAWRAYVGQTPEVWHLSGDPNFLFYPGDEGVIGSIRAELVRDGIEDYDYLALLRGQLAGQDEMDAELRALSTPLPLLLGREAIDWPELEQSLLDRRKRIGRVLR